jgi:hypothetical protein
MEMARVLNQKLRQRYHAVCDWFEYGEPIWFVALLLAALAAAVLYWLPSSMILAIVIAGLAVTVVVALFIPVLMATVAVWEGLFEWIGRVRAARQARNWQRQRTGRGFRTAAFR